MLSQGSRLLAQDLSEEAIRAELISHATTLETSGKEILLKEAREHQYFLLGELHGETEIPQLLSALWPALWEAGYRHVAAEVSPWAATHLQRNVADDPIPVPGLWTREQAAIVNRLAPANRPVLWGCDIEELQPDQLIRQVAQLNPEDPGLRRMAALVSKGYARNLAPTLLEIARSEHPVHDANIGGASLWTSTLRTLEVEALRFDRSTRYEASKTRELVMKTLFLQHSEQEPDGKVLFRFGRNHLHRGYDARGISTLGNFLVEWALSHGQSVVNVGAFAAGGKEHLVGNTFDADERQDEATFALLAGLAGKKATVFDLRSFRPRLHSIPAQKRTPLEANLIYWADSYDFLLCYPSVTPLMDPTAEPR